MRTPNKITARVFYTQESAVSALVVMKKKDEKKSDQTCYHHASNFNQLFIYGYGMISFLEDIINEIIKWWNDKQLRKKVLGYRKKHEQERKQLLYTSYSPQIQRMSIK